MLRPRTLLPALAALALGAFLLVDALVVTDEEAIETVVDQAADAVRRGDFVALRGLLAPDYRGEGRDAEGAVRRAEGAREALGAESLRVELLDLEVDGDRAQGPVKVSGSMFGRSGAVSLDVGFVRHDEGWRIQSARLSGIAERFSFGN